MARALGLAAIKPGPDSLSLGRALILHFSHSPAPCSNCLTQHVAFLKSSIHLHKSLGLVLLSSGMCDLLSLYAVKVNGVTRTYSWGIVPAPKSMPRGRCTINLLINEQAQAFPSIERPTKGEQLVTHRLLALIFPLGFP